MVVVFPMIVVVFNVNVEQVGQVVDVIKVCMIIFEKNSIPPTILVSSYCMKYNPCVCRNDPLNIGL